MELTAAAAVAGVATLQEDAREETFTGTPVRYSELIVVSGPPSRD